jgi:hypothetical protein
MEVGLDIDDHMDGIVGRAFLDVRGRGARTMIEKAMMDEVQLWLVADGRSRVDVLVPLACALRPAPFVSRQVGPSSALSFQPSVRFVAGCLYSRSTTSQRLIYVRHSSAHPPQFQDQELLRPPRLLSPTAAPANLQHLHYYLY